MDTRDTNIDDVIESTRRWIRDFMVAIVDHPDGVSVQTLKADQLVVFVLHTHEVDRNRLVQHREHPIQCLDTLLRLWGIRRARRYQLLVDGGATTISIGDEEPAPAPVPRAVIEKGFERGHFRVHHGD